MAESVDLIKAFSSVVKTLAANQTSLNEADAYNHDHGDHMVETFEMITKAMREKKNASPADQLAYASQLLREKSSSGSGKIYASNLEQAAAQIREQVVTPQNASLLVQTLLGSGAQQSGGSAGGGDLLGSLLSGLTGGKQQKGSEQQSGMDLGDLAAAGISFMQAKQSGKSDMDALIGALVNNSTVGQEPHRAQSGMLVAQTLISALGAMTSKQ